MLEEAAIKIPVALAKGSARQALPDRLGGEAAGRRFTARRKGNARSADRMPADIRLQGHYDPASGATAAPGGTTTDLPQGAGRDAVPASPPGMSGHSGSVKRAPATPSGMPDAAFGRVPSHPPGLGEGK